MTQVVFTWGQDGLQSHTEGDTMKNIVKTVFRPWRCKKEPDRELNRKEERKREREREAQSGGKK